MNVVEFDRIDRAYKAGTKVLDGVTFSIGAGEVVGLLGKNGVGKTTLIRIAMGMLEPQRGSVRIFGLDPRSEALEVKRRIGFVSEEQIIPEFLSVQDVIRLYRGLFPTWDEKMERELRERFEIPLASKIRTLSKGQARRVALLCAVAHRPELLLLDEPAGGLDPAARREFLETSIHLLNEAGSTILFSSHYMTDVERLAGRIVMLHDGKVLIDRPLDELREEYALALVSHGPNVTREALVALEGCLGVRRRGDGMHAVFSVGPDRARDLLRDRLGVTDVRTRTVALEEMFIELAGGQG